jgi:hypothetical protein
LFVNVKYLCRVQLQKLSLVVLIKDGTQVDEDTILMEQYLRYPVGTVVYYRVEQTFLQGSKNTVDMCIILYI